MNFSKLTLMGLIAAVTIGCAFGSFGAEVSSASTFDHYLRATLQLLHSTNFISRHINNQLALNSDLRNVLSSPDPVLSLGSITGNFYSTVLEQSRGLQFMKEQISEENYAKFFLWFLDIYFPAGINEGQYGCSGVVLPDNGQCGSNASNQCLVLGVCLPADFHVALNPGVCTSGVYCQRQPANYEIPHYVRGRSPEGLKFCLFGGGEMLFLRISHRPPSCNLALSLYLPSDRDGQHGLDLYAAQSILLFSKDKSDPDILKVIHNKGSHFDCYSSYVEKNFNYRLGGIIPPNTRVIFAIYEKKSSARADSNHCPDQIPEGQRKDKHKIVEDAAQDDLHKTFEEEVSVSHDSPSPLRHPAPLKPRKSTSPNNSVSSSTSGTIESLTFSGQNTFSSLGNSVNKKGRFTPDPSPDQLEDGMS